MRTAGCRWMVGLALALGSAGPLAAPAAADFPPADSGYHSYAEVTSELASIASKYPSIMRRLPLGKSYEQRDIQAIKISDNAATDEAEPEVLFDANQHAREHLTVEMAMYLVNELTSKYATDARIRNVVDTREIWIIPTVNPDGAEYDIASGIGYAQWRKNRQPNAAGDFGTDLNRNWGWQWGCCNGSSATSSSDDYRGAAAFSAPETQAVRDFVLSRRIGGVQQIKASIDFHSFGELVMWPFAYTLSDTAPGMTQEQRDAFAALGQSMAQSNAYTPQQASDLYISDGNLRDWLWGQEGIFAYGFEMYPGPSSPNGGGFYPPDEVIAAQTSRNREAALRLIESADCPYRAIGKELQYCGIGTDPGAGSVTLPGTGAGPAAPPPPTTDEGDAGERATVTIVADRAGLAAGGHVRLRLRCTAVVATRCRGVLKLAARLPGFAKVRTIAKTNYVIVSGTHAVMLRLGPKSRRALRRRTAITVTATVTSQQEATGAITTATKRVRLVRKDVPARRA